MTEAKISLVGYTGFVGSNIFKNGKFDGYYNSSNIQNAFGTEPDILIYAGLRAEKYIANKYPDKDKASIENAMDNIRLINPKKIVLISTIDVYDSFKNVNEETIPNKLELLPYGENRLFLEEWIENNYDDYCIIRLPGLFGDNIKKNFIYDFINKIPFKLTEQKYKELQEKEKSFGKYYLLCSDGFYQCKKLNSIERNELIALLDKVNFSALNFTDSRGIYQFYNLDYLWNHITICQKNNIKKINMATEPVSIDEVYNKLTGNHFDNKLVDCPPSYNFKSIYADKFGGANGYLFTKDQVLNDISKFVSRYEEKVKYVD